LHRTGAAESAAINARKRAERRREDFLPHVQYWADRRDKFGSTMPAMRLQPPRQKELRRTEGKVPTPARLEFSTWSDRRI
jgi:hypothetical protein